MKREGWSSEGRGVEQWGGVVKRRLNGWSSEERGVEQ